ncbi:hypothetical protein BKA58DRAFT_402755 [Alternaria rosae]|uniref:uncharacterized protein n=1 Tax=Alternaria rosae TaxID=1187941 RepID=UPI001E8CC7C8|nr:uncharacterized protein BKA58DRAFT_402755 [Alternaria rosae]KAH6868382.1 hypothetical protein BKA58DRAFT_402755 [Alternaria rosae]
MLPRDGRRFYIEPPGGVIVGSTARHELNGPSNKQISGSALPWARYRYRGRAASHSGDFATLSKRLLRFRAKLSTLDTETYLARVLVHYASRLFYPTSHFLLRRALRQYVVSSNPLYTNALWAIDSSSRAKLQLEQSKFRRMLRKPTYASRGVRFPRLLPYYNNLHTRAANGIIPAMLTTRYPKSLHRVPFRRASSIVAATHFSLLTLACSCHILSKPSAARLESRPICGRRGG